MADPERFLALLESLRQSLLTLDRYRTTVARDRLVSDVDVQNMVLFALYRAVQGAIDLGQHLIAERGLIDSSGSASPPAARATRVHFQ